MQSIGEIREIEGPVVLVEVKRLPPLGQALRVDHNDRSYILEVHQHLDERSLRTVAMNSTTGLRRGLPVFDTGAPLTVPVGESCLGRVLNLFGEPLDGGPQLVEENKVGRVPRRGQRALARGRLVDGRVVEQHGLGGLGVESRKESNF